MISEKASKEQHETLKRFLDLLKALVRESLSLAGPYLPSAPPPSGPACPGAVGVGGGQRSVVAGVHGLACPVLRHPALPTTMRSGRIRSELRTSSRMAICPFPPSWRGETPQGHQVLMVVLTLLIFDTGNGGVEHFHRYDHRQREGDGHCDNGNRGGYRQD